MVTDMLNVQQKTNISSALRPLVIKLGGAALADTDTLSKLFQAIYHYQSQSARAILIVHGGGYLVDDLMTSLDLPIEKKQGLRVTPNAHIPFIAGALAGTANKLLQAQAVMAGLHTFGMSLADAGLCEVEQIDVELGHVGCAKPGNSDALTALLAQHILPLISSIGIDNQGRLMNVNADQAAVAVASALNAELVLLSDVQGVLDGKGCLQKALTRDQAETMIAQGVITDGMIVKVRAAFDAAQQLGRTIEVASWRYPDQLAQLLDGLRIGTRFTVS